jgi:hypothetical protein
MHKKRRIMSARRKPSRSDHRRKALKPRLWRLLETIKRAANTTSHTLRNRIPRQRLHVDLFTQLTIKKGIHIRLRDGLLTNRGHNKKSVNSHHVSNRSKCLIIIMVMFLLETMRNQSSLIAHKRTIQVSLNLINPLPRGGYGTSVTPQCYIGFFPVPQLVTIITCGSNDASDT